MTLRNSKDINRSGMKAFSRIELPGGHLYGTHLPARHICPWVHAMRNLSDGVAHQTKENLATRTFT
jgi:hypothetical protein